MRSSKQPTWGWSDILAATGYTDAALRRQFQRKQVEFEALPVNGRTRATIWDIARLRISRHFCYIGMEPKEAFGLAKIITGLAYRDSIEGRGFTTAAGKKQRIIFAVCLRQKGTPAELPRIISIDPNDTDYAAKAFKELVLQTTNPDNGILPVHWFVLDAWSKLPDLPENMSAWIDISRKNMQRIFN
jgi:hypothetical protein